LRVVGWNEGRNKKKNREKKENERRDQLTREGEKE